jgi:putative hemolysin
MEEDLCTAISTTRVGADRALAPSLTVGVASGALVIEDALRLRYKVFAEEMGAAIGDGAGLDVDEFDEHCDHIVVRDRDTLRVVGTYRVLPPHRARRLGRLYSESEFDLRRLDHLRPAMIEVGRSCVHRDYRSGPALMLLWAALARYMKTHNYRYLIGCASAPLSDGGLQAAQVRATAQRHLTPPEYRVFPRLPFPHEQIQGFAHAEIPLLIKGYLRLGARICGEPAWDPRFNCADFPVLLALDWLSPRYARHFDLAATNAWR